MPAKYQREVIVAFLYLQRKLRKSLDFNINKLYNIVMKKLLLFLMAICAQLLGIRLQLPPEIAGNSPIYCDMQIL